MNIIFGAVSDVSAEVLGNVLWSERVIVHFTLHEMIFCALIGKRFQKRAAPRAGASQDNWRAKLERSNSVGCENKDYGRSISPGRSTPSNPVRMSRKGGWRIVRKFSRMILGLKNESKVV
jgi:hypothetical protein